MYTVLVSLVVVSMVLPAASWGQSATPESAPAQRLTQAQPLYYGGGVRFRGIFVPRKAFERFVDVAPSGIAKPELGVEFVRRRGHFESSLGIAWANISADNGIWVDDLTDLDDNPSLIEFDGFSWITLDVNAIWRLPFGPTTALRYGIGVGLGILQGDILETDYACPTNRFDLDNCTQAPDADDVRRPIDLPPVVPIINALVGFQYAPIDRVSINLDAGLQTALFVGISVDFFFPARSP